MTQHHDTRKKTCQQYNVIGSAQIRLRRYFAAQYIWLTVRDLFACFKSVQSPPPQEISFVQVFLCRPSPTAPTVKWTKARYLMWRNTDTTVFRGDIVLRKAYTRYPFGGLPRHFVPRNDILRKKRLFKCFLCSFIHHLHAVQISSVADGFHLAQQDFICRKANFIARTLLYAPGVGGRGSGAVGEFLKCEPTRTAHNMLIKSV